MRAVILLVATACGRVGFDRVPADAVPFSPCPEPRAISVNDGDGQPPTVATNGAGLAVAWHDYRRNGELTANVALIGADETLTRVELMRGLPPSLVAPFPMGIACSGTSCGVAWQESGASESTTYFAVIDADGVIVAAPTIIDPSFSAYPSVVWTGTEFAVAYAVNETLPPGTNDPSFINLRRYDPSGQPLGAPTRLSDDTARSLRPVLVWTGSSFIVTWTDGRGATAEAYVVAADASGTKLGPDLALGPVLEVSGIAWNSREAVVAYQGPDTNPGLHLARLDSSAQLLDKVDHAAVELFNPTIVARDSGWVVAGRPKAEQGAFIQRFDALLSPVEGRMPLWPFLEETPSMTWTGNRLAIAIADRGTYPGEIYLTAICP